MTRRNHIWHIYLKCKMVWQIFLVECADLNTQTRTFGCPFLRHIFRNSHGHKVGCCEENSVANLATNFKDLLGSTINLETLTVVLGAVSCPASLKRKKEGANNYLVSITNNFITHHRVWTWLRWPSRSLLLRYWRLTCRAANLYITHLLHHLWINAHTILFH